MISELQHKDEISITQEILSYSQESIADYYREDPWLLNYLYWGIGLTQVTTRYSILKWQTILAHWKPSISDFPLRWLAWIIWPICVGRMVLYAQIVVPTKHGEQSVVCGIVANAGFKNR